MCNGKHSRRASRSPGCCLRSLLPVTAGVLPQEMLERLARNFGVDSPDQLTEAQQKVPASSTGLSYLVLGGSTAFSVEIFSVEICRHFFSEALRTLTGLMPDFDHFRRQINALLYRYQNV